MLPTLDSGTQPSALGIARSRQRATRGGGWEEQGSFSFLTLSGRAPGSRAAWARGNPRASSLFAKPVVRLCPWVKHIWPKSPRARSHLAPDTPGKPLRHCLARGWTRSAPSAWPTTAPQFPCPPSSSPGESPRRNFQPRTDLSRSQRRGTCALALLKNSLLLRRHRGFSQPPACQRAAAAAGLPLPPGPRRWGPFLANSCLLTRFLHKGALPGCGISSSRAGGPLRTRSAFPSFLGLSRSAQPSLCPARRRLNPGEGSHPPLPAAFFRKGR